MQTTTYFHCGWCFFHSMWNRWVVGVFGLLFTISFSFSLSICRDLVSIFSSSFEHPILQANTLVILELGFVFVFASRDFYTPKMLKHFFTLCLHKLINLVNKSPALKCDDVIPQFSIACSQVCISILKWTEICYWCDLPESKVSHQSNRTHFTRLFAI